MPYIFDLDRLDRLAAERADEFAAARPYPHLVIDDVLRRDDALALARDFPGPGGLAWDHYAAPGLEVKLGSSREEAFPPAHRRAMHELNSGVFVRFLERITGIAHLLPDPHLVGGGLHMTRRAACSASMRISTGTRACRRTGG